MLVCEEEQYVPTAEDVGRGFKVEALVVQTVEFGDELLAGPVVAYTEPVLAFPSASVGRTFGE